MGLAGQLNHPQVLGMIEKAVGQIRKAGKIAGIYASNAPAIKLKDMGCQYLMVSADNLIRQVGREYLAAVRRRKSQERLQKKTETHRSGGSLFFYSLRSR